MSHPTRRYMETCIELAREASASGDYPIGSVVVDESGTIISTGKNALLSLNDPTAHPEVLAIRAAAESLESRYLEGCFLYTTLEPCPMCTAAAIWAKMAGIVFGATQADAIAEGERCPSDVYTWRQILIPCRQVADRGTPQVRVFGPFMQSECAQLLRLTCDG